MIGQGTAAVAGPEPRRRGRATSSGDRAARRGDAGHRAVGLRAARRHVRHARGRDQPERHHHRHQPHRRPRARPRRGGGRDREPAQQRPRRQVRRRALHVRRPRRGDERRRPRRRSTRRSRPATCSRSRSRTAVGALDADRAHELLAALRALPDAMAHGARPARRRSRPSRSATRCRAGTGPSSATGRNRIAAHEVRIKLSELCYKSISCDVTEDKKHIDLSSEPLILVCAAGLAGFERRRRRQGGRDLPRAPRPRRS